MVVLKMKTQTSVHFTYERNIGNFRNKEFIRRNKGLRKNDSGGDGVFHAMFIQPKVKDCLTINK